MFPWVYGWEWHPGYLIFIGVFFTVALVVAGTLVTALWRSFQSVRRNEAGRIAWHATFEDLAPAERRCRHAITGKLPDRICDHELDCRDCRMHARLAWSDAAAEAAAAPAPEEVCGVAVPQDRCYHRGHTWIREEEDGTLTVGLDDLGRRLLGEDARLELPAPGAKLRVNEPAFRARRDGVEVRVLSPVDGTVAGPAGDGEGLFRVRPAEGFRTTHLLRGAEAVAWMREELDRLQIALSAAGGAPALANGGTVPEDLGRRLDPRQYDNACGLAFLDV